MFRNVNTLLRLTRVFRPTLQILESRCVATTTISQLHNFVVVTGDAGNQNITITQTGNGKFNITAADLKAGTATTKEHVHFIAVQTLTGNDTVTLIGNSSQPIYRGVEIRGDGNLTVYQKRLQIDFNYGDFSAASSPSGSIKVFADPGTILGREVEIYGGNNNDVVVLPGAYVKGNSLISLGRGDNRTSMQNTNIDGLLTIVGNIGNDQVFISGGSIGSFNPGAIILNLESGNNQVVLSNTGTGGGFTNGHLTLQANGGNTSLAMANCTFNGNVNYGGGGIVATITNSKVTGKVKFTTYNGATDILVSNSQIGNKFESGTTQGNQKILLENSTIAVGCLVGGNLKGEFKALNLTLNGSMAVNYGTAAHNSVHIQGGLVSGIVGITTGAGNDTIKLLGATIGDLKASGVNKATITTGAGNDMLNVSGTAFSSDVVQFSGNAGFNQLILGGAIFMRTIPRIYDFNF